MRRTTMKKTDEQNNGPAVHPCVAAWRQFKKSYPRSFEAGADGVYLENRLQDAFQEGWIACERRIKAVMDGR